jgi:hypothetical protein
MKGWIRAAQEKRTGKLTCVSPKHWFGGWGQNTAPTLQLEQLRIWPVVWVGKPSDRKGEAAGKNVQPESIADGKIIGVPTV